MKEFRRKKLAFALACASILGGKTQAMNKPQSQETVAAVVGATTKNSSKGFVNLAKNHKWQLAVGIVVPVATVASILTFFGVKYGGKKEKDNKPIKDKNNEEIINDAINQAKEETEGEGEVCVVGGLVGHLDGEGNMEDPKQSKAYFKKLGITNEKQFNDYIKKLTMENEKQLRTNIEKLKKLLLNKENWFSKNFVEYCQIKEQNGKYDLDFCDAGRNKDWDGANMLFSFNDNVCSKLDKVFSEKIKLIEFGVTSAYQFSFGFDGCSIFVIFDKDESILRISYSDVDFTKGERKSYHFKFNMPKDI